VLSRGTFQSINNRGFPGFEKATMRLLFGGMKAKECERVKLASS
jgi:hypothetical protein